MYRIIKLINFLYEKNESNQDHCLFALIAAGILHTAGKGAVWQYAATPSRGQSIEGPARQHCTAVTRVR